MNLFGKDKIYLSRKLRGDDIAVILGEDSKEVGRTFEKEFGYPFHDMVSIWRLCHARDLLLRKVPYSLVWKLSGFESRKEMERELDRLIY